MLLGEGNFSFATNFVKSFTHIDPKKIYATELRKKEELEEIYSKNFKNNYNFLLSKGVKILFEFDACKLSTRSDKILFKTIIWNCPFSDPKYNLSSSLICSFLSASFSQEIGSTFFVRICKVYANCYKIPHLLKYIPYSQQNLTAEYPHLDSIVQYNHVKNKEETSNSTFTFELYKFTRISKQINF